MHDADPADRRPMRIHLIAVAACVSAFTLFAPRANAQALQARDHAVELGVMFWKPSPELIISTPALVGAGGDDVNFVQELGIEDTSFREFRAVLGRKHKVRISFVSFKYDAETTIQRTIVFQGRTFNIGVPASTDITWDLWNFGYEWDFVSRERGFLGAIVDVKYNKIKASIDSPALTSTASVETTAPVPTFGVIGRGYVAPMVTLTAEFTGLNLTRDEFEAKFFDFDFYGTVLLGRNVGVQAGYRSVVVEYLVDDDRGDLKMKGPYVGWVLRF